MTDEPRLGHEEGPERAGAPGRRRVLLLGTAIVIAAMNLRPAVASVGPVLEDIQRDMSLSSSAASMLTALPILCFGAGALVAPRLARRAGSDLVLTVVLGTTTAGLVMRAVPTTLALFAGTFLAGAAIAIANVLIPAVVKREFSHRLGLMMGVYISVTMGMAALSAGLTAPIVQAFGGQWRIGLAVWAVPALAGFAIWAFIGAARRGRWTSDDRSIDVPASLLREPVAWQVTGFMGLQALGFYALLAWLPTIHRSYGVSPERAGHLLSVMVIVGVPAALFLPSLLTRSSRQSIWSLVTGGLIAAGMLGLLLAPTHYPVLWSLLIGLGTGTVLPLALTLVVLRSRNAEDASQLSAMSQSVGYGMAAAGPFLFGLLYGVTGGWTASLLFLLVLLVPQVLVGVAAGRPVYVRG